MIEKSGTGVATISIDELRSRKWPRVSPEQARINAATDAAIDRAQERKAFGFDDRSRINPSLENPYCNWIPGEE